MEEKRNHSNDPNEKQPIDDKGRYTTDNKNKSVDNFMLLEDVGSSFGDNENEFEDEDLLALGEQVSDDWDDKDLLSLGDDISDEWDDEEDNVFSKFYDDEDALAESLPKMFTKETVEEFKKGSSNNYIRTVKQKTGNEYIPVLAHIFMKMRFKKTKFEVLSKDEFDKIAKNAIKDKDITSGNFYDVMRAAQRFGNQVVAYRGVPTGDNHYLQEDVFNGYFTSETNPQTGDEDGRRYPITLLGTGNYDSVIYMATQHDYARSYAGDVGEGVLISALVNLENTKICYEEHEDFSNANMLYNVRTRCKNAWLKSKEKVRRSLMEITDKYTADEIIKNMDEEIEWDAGFNVSLCGYDALVCGRGNGNQLDILNPNIVRVKETYER